MSWSPFLDGDGDDAAPAHVVEVREVRLLDDARACGEEDVQRRVPGLIDRTLVRADDLALHADGRGDLFVGPQVQEVDDGAPLRRAAALGQLVDALDVAAPGLGEEHQVVVRAGREQVLDEIARVFLGRALAGRHADDALAAAALRAVLAGERALDEPGVRDGDDRSLVGDEVFHVDLALVGHDLGQARRGVLRLDGLDLFLDDRQHARLLGQDVHQVLDRDHQLGVFAGDLVALQAGELVQAQVQDGVGLPLAEGVAAVHEAGRRAHLDAEPPDGGLVEAGRRAT